MCNNDLSGKDGGRYALAVIGGVVRAVHRVCFRRGHTQKMKKALPHPLAPIVRRCTLRLSLPSVPCRLLRLGRYSHGLPCSCRAFTHAHVPRPSVRHDR